jgi:hypothetical protein
MDTSCLNPKGEKILPQIKVPFLFLFKKLVPFDAKNGISLISNIMHERIHKKPYGFPKKTRVHYRIFFPLRPWRGTADLSLSPVGGFPFLVLGF